MRSAPYARQEETVRPAPWSPWLFRVWGVRYRVLYHRCSYSLPYGVTPPIFHLFSIELIFSCVNVFFSLNCPGYYALASDPSTFVTCSPASACPGGENATCAAGKGVDPRSIINSKEVAKLLFKPKQVFNTIS